MRAVHRKLAVSGCVGLTAALVFLAWPRAGSAQLRASEDADRVRSSASGVIHGLTLQMNPATDSCLRGHALFELGGTGLAIDLRDDTDRQSARLYDLVVEAVVGEREVSVHYVGDESIKEWVRACDAFAADKKFFRVRALTLGKATGSGPRPRPRSRSHG